MKTAILIWAAVIAFLTLSECARSAEVSTQHLLSTAPLLSTSLTTPLERVVIPGSEEHVGTSEYNLNKQVRRGFILGFLLASFIATSITWFIIPGYSRYKRMYEYFLLVATLSSGTLCLFWILLG